MNEIILKGIINNIMPSHKIKDIEYSKADLIVPKRNGEEDIIKLRFKKFSCPYTDGQEIEVLGNVRSYSQQLEDGHNKVEIYVFTYFDIPEIEDEIINQVKIDGRVCKIDKLRKTKSDKDTLHFTLANNIISAGNKQKLNNYIPITAWGSLAKSCVDLQVSDQLEISGQLHSRMYNKILADDTAEKRIAYEIIPSEIFKL